MSGVIVAAFLGLLAGIGAVIVPTMVWLMMRRDEIEAVALYRAARAMQRLATDLGPPTERPSRVRSIAIWDAGGWLAEDYAPRATGLTFWEIDAATNRADR